eukprot:TRINITY_DN18041_c0_g1_i1.p2 TRINITY_DN18041_c0_g1~~TRINITY_DN18041_c0_g1_i1.p2  ORF type:complete len:644 (+),score=170.64 TRINITY_DN18041_c0_g1_i1:99-1934(+)
MAAAGAETRAVTLQLTPKVSLAMQVAPDCSCADLAAALSILLARPAGQIVLEAAEGGQRLSGADPVPDAVRLGAPASPSRAPVRAPLTRSQTGPAPPPGAGKPPRAAPAAAHVDAAQAPGAASPPRKGPRQTSASAPRPAPQGGAAKGPPSPAARPAAPAGAPQHRGSDAAPAALEEGRKALRALQPADLRRLAKGNPGGALGQLMDAVLTALGNARPNWESAQRELDDIKFIDKVCRVDPPQGRMMRRVEQLAASAGPAHHDDIRKQGGAAGVALAQWVTALVGGNVQQQPAENGAAPAAEPAARPPARKEKERPAPVKAPVQAHPAPGATRRATATQDTPRSGSAPAGSLESAREALDALSNAELREVRSTATPTPAVEKTLAAVLTVLNHRNTEWDNAKKQMSNTKAFVQTLCDVAKNPEKHLQLSRHQTREVQKMVKDPALSPDSMAKAPVAAQAMAQWVRAVCGHCVSNIKQDHPPGASPAAAPAAPPAAAPRAPAQQIAPAAGSGVLGAAAPAPAPAPVPAPEAEPAPSPPEAAPQSADAEPTAAPVAEPEAAATEEASTEETAQPASTEEAAQPPAEAGAEQGGEPQQADPFAGQDPKDFPTEF